MSEDLYKTIEQLRKIISEQKEKLDAYEIVRAMFDKLKEEHEKKINSLNNNSGGEL